MLAYIGDANNVARSLAFACGKLGVPMAVASPEGYGFNDEAIDRLKSELPGIEIRCTADPAEALRDAAFVYTDVMDQHGAGGRSEATSP